MKHIQSEKYEHIVYLDKGGQSGWYWTKRSGNRVIYTGPFRTEEGAKHDMDTHWEST